MEIRVGERRRYLYLVAQLAYSTRHFLLLLVSLRGYGGVPLGLAIFQRGLLTAD